MCDEVHVIVLPERLRPACLGFLQVPLITQEDRVDTSPIFRAEVWRPLLADSQVLVEAEEACIGLQSLPAAFDVAADFLQHPVNLQLVDES